MPPPDRLETHPPNARRRRSLNPDPSPQNSNCGFAYKSDKKNPPDAQTIPPTLCVPTYFLSLTFHIGYLKTLTLFAATPP